MLESDRGCYMCQVGMIVSHHLRQEDLHILTLQINTEKMKQQNGCLDVNVPPDIDYLQTSQDVVTQEVTEVKHWRGFTYICLTSGRERHSCVQSLRTPNTPNNLEKRGQREYNTESCQVRTQLPNIVHLIISTKFRDKNGTERYEGENLTISK